MASDEDDKTPLPEDPTDIFIRPRIDPPQLDDDQPTEEATRPASIVVPNEPTRDSDAARPLTVHSFAYGRLDAENTIGSDLEEVSETVGAHLEVEVSETVGTHLEADGPSLTIGEHLQPAGLHHHVELLRPQHFILQWIIIIFAVILCGIFISK